MVTHLAGEVLALFTQVVNLALQFQLQGGARYDPVSDVILNIVPFSERCFNVVSLHITEISILSFERSSVTLFLLMRQFMQDG